MFVADDISPKVSGHVLLTGWQTGALSVVALVIEIAIAAWYVWSVVRLRRRGRIWSPWRTASFLGGMALVVVAVQSGVAAYDDSVFEIHVVQHLLLMNFAPILLVLGAPVTLALQASSRPSQQGLLKIIHHPVFESLTNPIFVVSLANLTMLVYFLSPIYRISLEHPLLHDYTHLHFLVSGYVFWSIVIGLDPSRWRLSYPAKLGMLAVGVPVNVILGIALTGARTSIAPEFHSLADTRAGGSVLWVLGELITVLAIAITVLQWMRYEEREGARADRRLDAAEAEAAQAADAEAR